MILLILKIYLAIVVATFVILSFYLAYTEGYFTVLILKSFLFVPLFPIILFRYSCRELAFRKAIKLGYDYRRRQDCIDLGMKVKGDEMFYTTRNHIRVLLKKSPSRQATHDSDGKELNKGDKVRIEYNAWSRSHYEYEKETRTLKVGTRAYYDFIDEIGGVKEIISITKVEGK